MTIQGSLSSELLVKAPATEVWGAYRGLEVTRLVNELLSTVLGTVEVLEGDGGVGTVLKVTLAAGGYFKERFIVMDDEVRVKVTETLEGGYLALGFKAYRLRCEVIQKGETSAVVKSSVEYELDDADADKARLVDTTLVDIIAEAFGKYVEDKYKASALKAEKTE